MRVHHMHVNIDEISGIQIEEGVIERQLLRRDQTASRNLEVKHYVLKRGQVTFLQENVEFQHYIISGCALFNGRYLHGETAIFVPGNKRFGEFEAHTLKHSGEGELRILSTIYHTPRSNMRWTKPRIKNLYEVPIGYSGMYAQQLFTEEEHAVMGALRMHSLDLQTHAPGIELTTHKNPEEFGYFLRGTGEVYADSECFSIRPGSLVYTAEGVPHSIKNTSKTIPLQYLAFEFTEQDKSWSEMKA
jgi:mannose-6-phosphate isomerase-like protein (cupin superfamily)